MADNNGTSGGGDSSNNQSNTIALAALVISIGALITTVLQVVQQYLASADGFRRCAPSVMGLWAKNTTRKLSWRELRFEVVFEAPVIFIAPPGNMRGPVWGAPILEVDGSNYSYEKTQTMKPGRDKISNVHTADDERASWVTLLAAFQRNEHDSREWERVNTKSARGNKYEGPKYGICYMMQKKKRSWDFMPSNIIKPFATTTLCHLVEMMAMLGLYWKQFDLEKGLRAEGNGYMLTSTTVHGLGIVTTFSMTGPAVPRFEDNRVIPCNALKELVFGSVPCILDRSLELTQEDLPRTLLALGLSKADVKLFLEKQERTQLFGLTFEVMAMVAKPFRIRGSNFRKLPNPCEDKWRPGVDMLACLRAFKVKFDSYYNDLGLMRRGSLLFLIRSQFADDRFSDQVMIGNLDLDVREAAHTALDETADQLSSKHIRFHVLRSVLAAHIGAMLSFSDVLEQSLLDEDRFGTKEERLMRVYFDKMMPQATRYTTAGATGVAPMLTDVQQDERSAIWLCLLLRMWCWFLLHDFDPSDRLSVPSQFMGSRMPVFIG